jgi:hypothetical protein
MKAAAMASRRSDIDDTGALTGLTRALIDLISELGDAKEKWGRTDGKLDVFIEQLKIQDQRTTELEVRMRKVENRQHWYAGAGAVLGALFGKFVPGLFHSP